jgi:hypothetical protein
VNGNECLGLEGGGGYLYIDTQNALPCLRGGGHSLLLINITFLFVHVSFLLVAGRNVEILTKLYTGGRLCTRNLVVLLEATFEASDIQNICRSIGSFSSTCLLSLII